MATKKVAAEAEVVDDGDDTTAVATPEVSDRQAAALRATVRKLRSSINDGYWNLAAALHKVHETLIYTKWGFAKFQDYLESDEVAHEYRSGMYLVRIYEHFSKLPEGAVEWIKQLGWTKAKELIPKVTAENWREWKQKTDGLSFSELQALLKGGDGVAEEKAAGSESEAEEKAKEKFVKRNFNLPEEIATVVEAAVENAKAAGNTDKDSRALELICVDYMTGRSGIQEAVPDYLARVERAVGLRIIAYSPDKDEVVYGESLLDELEKADVDGES